MAKTEKKREWSATIENLFTKSHIPQTNERNCQKEHSACRDWAIISNSNPHCQ